MNKNYIFIAIFLVVVIVLVGAFVLNNLKPEPKLQDTNNNAIVNNSINNANNLAQEQIKEFKMDSFYEMVDGKAKPQYSLTEITVKKGNIVRIQITVTKGNHDFNIDEYNVHAETPLDIPITVVFKADKVGEFVYYCSKPGHREAGHWGTLKVIE